MRQLVIYKWFNIVLLVIVVFFLLLRTLGIGNHIISINSTVNIYYFLFYLLTSLSILILSSTFKSIWGVLSIIGMVIILLGYLAKIEHWAIANAFLNIGLILYVLFYGVRFYKKPLKDYLDVTKFIFAIFYTVWLLLLVIGISREVVVYEIRSILKLGSEILLFTIHLLLIQKLIDTKKAQQNLQQDIDNSFHII